MSALLKALWRDQTERHPEPPTPALVDACYEAGLDELAWRLHWCAANRVVPEVQVFRESYARLVYNWHRESLFGTVLFDAMSRFHDSGNGNWWAFTLRAAYGKLLFIPRSAFSCRPPSTSETCPSGAARIDTP